MDKVKVKSRDIKKEKIAALGDKIGRAKTIVFVDYHGLSANQVSQLRQKVKAAGGELMVFKNTLMGLALKGHKLAVADDQLLGPTATLFAYEDEIAPLKEVASFVKELGLPKYKFGFFEKDLLDTATIENLAKIPSREVLHAQLVGSLSSPIYGFVNVLSANMRNLVYVLSQISSKSEA